MHLNEKIATLDYTDEYPKMNVRKLFGHFSLVVKPAISNILKDSTEKLAKGLKLFQGKLQEASPWKVSYNK